MDKQMTIFDILYPERINPIREVAKNAEPQWQQSKDTIMRFVNDDRDIKIIAKVVRHQYCPYGAYGYYGGTGEPNTMRSYDMRTDLIKVEYYDENGALRNRAYSWEDFAREVADLIWSGEYLEGK